MIYRNVKRSEAYHGLSAVARSALIEVLDRYTGINNGMIGLGVRELAYELGCTKDTASRAMRELDDAGLVVPMKVGVWRGRRATEWRLTFHRCDVSGDLPNQNFPQRESMSQSDEKDANAKS
ncbi:hypothetical protein AUC68_11235 [Methyloceanibacter methanicus]|uniref:HTH marR-type domain-containing protein n=1 Tax=Methyloceanibacter methanicus TaxID=1774968 RepID=A0A1E3VWZ6_9HYPH|nr:hypothetical protein [Methyloceanibacter methanicus]ODR98065.1 hypothetical protein AUC68_11235 [Methyloceanibacter methanicus]